MSILLLKITKLSYRQKNKYGEARECAKLTQWDLLSSCLRSPNIWPTSTIFDDINPIFILRSFGSDFDAAIHFFVEIIYCIFDDPLQCVVNLTWKPVRKIKLFWMLHFTFTLQYKKPFINTLYLREVTRVIYKRIWTTKILRRQGFQNGNYEWQTLFFQVDLKKKYY